MYVRLIIICFFIFSFQSGRGQAPFLVVLGIAQDAGYPQINCNKDCCKKFWDKKIPHQKVSCLALFDPATKQKWIFDATPDFTQQLHETEKYQEANLSGIFLTHAHIGHYTGLMYLGREAMNAKEVSVFSMPRMQNYLQNNGPWSQLCSLKNIKSCRLKADSTIKLTDKISVTPLLVPHRDEFSETVGFAIRTENKSVLFIPDIDKWQRWDRDVKQFLKEFDYLFLDGTFYSDKELPGRNMSEIPHPFILESMDLFKDLAKKDKEKICFIHFNHSNPLLDKTSKEFKEVKSNGFKIAFESEKIIL